MIIDLDDYIKIPVEYRGISYVLSITAFEYVPGCPESGPSYSSGGEPAEPDEYVPIDGYADLEGEVYDILGMTSSEMDDIMQLTNNNDEWFWNLCSSHAETIEEVLSDKYNQISREMDEQRSAELCEWN